MDDSLRSVASEWERSEWMVPCGDDYDAAARWYERRCDGVDDDCVVVGEAKASKRRREAAESDAALTPEEMAFFDEVGWRFFEKDRRFDDRRGVGRMKSGLAGLIRSSRRQETRPKA